MNNKRETNKKELVLIVVIIIAFLGIIAWLAKGYMSDISNNSSVEVETKREPVTITAEPTVKTITEYVDKIVEVEVEKEITPEIIQDGLNDMGVLITEEYYFTQVEDYTSTKTYFKFFSSESNFVYSYDGVVTAGIDFKDITVTRDDANKKIMVSLPKASIQNTDIDYESFKVYKEKEGLWNPIKISDYNDAMIEFEKNAEKKAIEKGILDRADEGAKSLIKNFVNGLIDTDTYSVEFSTK